MAKMKLPVHDESNKFFRDADWYSQRVLFNKNL